MKRIVFGVLAAAVFPIAALGQVGDAPTIAALKALTGGAYTTVVRTGYVANGDAPAATYVWSGASSCADDGGSCIQPNVGSGRWILVPPATPIPVGIWGALCTGALGTDDTTAIQSAINYAQGTLRKAIKLQGSCNITAALHITGSLTVQGDGQSQTTVFPQSIANSAFDFDPADENFTFILKDLSITYPHPLTGSGATAVVIGNASFNNAGSIMSHVGIFYAPNGVYWQNAINEIMVDSHIQTFWSIGVRINSPLSPDSGGGIFRGNQIENNALLAAGSISIRWESGGGILFSENKLLSADVALDVLELGPRETSQFHFVNNLTCCTTTAAVQLRQSGGFQLTEMLIANNILDSPTRALYVPSNGVKWLNNLSFTGNLINSRSQADQNQITIYDTFGFTVANNLFKCNGTCTNGRPIFTDVSSDTGLIVQSTNSETGMWGAADFIASTNTTIAATSGGQTKACGGAIVVTNGVVTSC
jgi:hypothetical protein